MHRKTTASHLVIAAAAGLMLGLSLTSPTKAQTTLKLGVAALNEGMLPIQVAIDQGFLKAEGVSVQFISFKGGGPTVQAFAGGSVDFCVCAGDHVVRLANRGLDARIISGLDDHHSYALMSKADAPFTDWASLKGKRVGITSPGSLTDNTVRWSIKKAGLDPQKDFRITGAGVGAAMRASIETGQVEAGAVVVTEVDNFLKTGKFKVVVDWRPTEYASLVIIGRQRWVDANPKLARGLAQALSKGAKFIQTNPEASMKSVKTMYPNFTEEHAKDVVKTAQQRLSKDGSVSPKGFETMLEVVMSADATLKKISLADVDLQPKLVK